MRWVLLLVLAALAAIQHAGVGAITDPVDKNALLAFKAGVTQVWVSRCHPLSATVAGQCYTTRH